MLQQNYFENFRIFLDMHILKVKNKKNHSLTASVYYFKDDGRVFLDCVFEMCLVNNEILSPTARYVLVQNFST